MTQHQAPEVASELLPAAQADRDFAALWIVIAPQNAKIIRAGEWDHHPGVQAAARHRTRATQSLSLTVEDRTLGRAREALCHLVNAANGNPEYAEAAMQLRDVVSNALDRLQSLSLPVDIDRSGLAQEVDDISYAGAGT
jgi:hypothetical protein